MSDKSINVTEQYAAAHDAAERYNPGEQPNIGKLMRTAFMHGYAQALIDRDASAPAIERLRSFVEGVAECSYDVEIQGDARDLLKRLD